jgi:hypothetical protein
LPKDRADKIFKYIMLDLGTPRVKAELMYLAVKLFGQSAWDKKRPRTYEDKSNYPE